MFIILLYIGVLLGITSTFRYQILQNIQYTNIRLGLGLIAEGVNIFLLRTKGYHGIEYSFCIARFLSVGII